MRCQHVPLDQLRIIVSTRHASSLFVKLAQGEMDLAHPLASELDHFSKNATLGPKTNWRTGSLAV